jgi:hypothetical protein
MNINEKIPYELIFALMRLSLLLKWNILQFFLKNMDNEALDIYIFFLFNKIPPIQQHTRAADLMKL